MRSLRAITALIALIALTAAATRPIKPYPTRFPAGKGHLIAERACAICHSAMLVTQQAKDSTGWEKTLATMEKWGAPVSGADHDTLRVYLVSHFGPKRK